MHGTARQTTIHEAVTRRGACSVAELAAALEVSDETIRRDIRQMAERGLVRKVHGGVTLLDPMTEPGFNQRMDHQAEAKRAIAQCVARLVKNGDSLMFDTGSTTAYAARALRDHRGLMVVTNSVDIGRTLANRNGNRVYLAGGELRADDGAAFGPAAADFVRQFHVRHAFLSIGGIDATDGLMDFDPVEADFSRAVLERAERRVVLADTSKFGRRAVVRVCALAGVDTLIAERAPPAPFADALDAAGVRLITADALAPDRQYRAASADD